MTTKKFCQYDSDCTKLALGIFVLRSCANNCLIQVLITAYYDLIYAHLSYGVVLWGASANNYLLRAVRLQKKTVRIITQNNPMDSCRSTLKKWQLLTLPSFYIFEIIELYMSEYALKGGRDV